MPFDPGAAERAACMAVELALAAGAAQADAFAVHQDESRVTVRRGSLEKLVEAGSRSLGLRVIDGGRTAVCSTSVLSPEGLASLARETLELARVAAPDPHAGLPAPGELATVPGPELQLFDESLPGLAVDRKIELALACEDAAFATDPRITNSDGATVSSRVGEVAVANSSGFARHYPATSISLAVEVMADDRDGKKRNAHWFSAERFLHRLADAGEVGRTAARRAIAQLGATKIRTGELPVVFEPLAAADLMRLVAGCATGSALYRGATFLAGREGERIGSPLVGIVDDPLLPGRPGSRPFDGEGVATRRSEIIRGGTFDGFLFDVYSARRAGLRTTGSAGRSVDSLPAPAPSNLVWLAGARPAEELVAELAEGFYVTSLMGFGFNPTTGDFSRGAAGFWIESGKIAHPVAEVNVSGRMAEMLASVDAVGDDVAWFGSLAAPSVRISRMMVSGL